MESTWSSRQTIFAQIYKGFFLEAGTYLNHDVQG